MENSARKVRASYRALAVDVDPNAFARRIDEAQLLAGLPARHLRNPDSYFLADGNW